MSWAKIKAGVALLESTQTVKEKRAALMDTVTQIKTIRMGAREKACDTFDNLLIKFTNEVIDAVPS